MNDDGSKRDIRACSTALVRERGSGLYLLEYSRDRDVWQIPGGRLHFNEPPYDGLLRELSEELSFDTQKARDIRLAAVDFRYNKEAGDSMTHFFFTLDYDGNLKDDLRPDNVEVNDLGLFTAEEVIDRLADKYAVRRVKHIFDNPGVAYYLENAESVF